MIEKRRLRAGPALALVAAFTGLAIVVTVAPASAEGPEAPGICHGRTTSNLHVTALAVGNGRQAADRYVLNVESDADKIVTGVLVAGSNADQLQVEEWCRLWKHRPGIDEPKGQCEPPGENDTAVHAVGVGRLRDGTRVLVRTDARTFGAEMKYRIRYREMQTHDEGSHDEGSHDDGGCGGGEGWTKVPPMGWLPLSKLQVRSD